MIKNLKQFYFYYIIIKHLLENYSKMYAKIRLNDNIHD